jgi:hypothetical protein
MSRSLRVLGSLGLAEPLFTRHIATPTETLAFKTDAELLAVSDIPSALPKHFGYPFAGVKRSVFLKYVPSTRSSLPREPVFI